MLKGAASQQAASEEELQKQRFRILRDKILSVESSKQEEILMPILLDLVKTGEAQTFQTYMLKQAEYLHCFEKLEKAYKEIYEADIRIVDCEIRQAQILCEDIEPLKQKKIDLTKQYKQDKQKRLDEFDLEHGFTETTRRNATKPEPKPTPSRTKSPASRAVSPSPRVATQPKGISEMFAGMKPPSAEEADAETKARIAELRATREAQTREVERMCAEVERTRPTSVPSTRGAPPPSRKGMVKPPSAQEADAEAERKARIAQRQAEREAQTREVEQMCAEVGRTYVPSERGAPPASLKTLAGRNNNPIVTSGVPTPRLRAVGVK